MKVRGKRECTACGTVWSYYDTGSPRCPECDSLQSVGLDDRTRHTDADVTLDLSPIRSQIDEGPEDEIADDAAQRARQYVRKRGFIDAGNLLPLDWRFVAAAEIAHVAAAYARRMQPTDEEELYFLSLLQRPDAAESPDPAAVPATFRGAFGLAMANAIEEYQRDLRTYLADAQDVDPTASSLAGRIRDQRKRLEALEGDVDPADAHRLLRATRDLGQAVAAQDPSSYVTADNWLTGIDGKEQT